ncbi:MAG: hypothetical protein HY356_05450 [Gammaproteobacteria bacterium]|nr:hypothetical protein [Gammaproteobacteria bacterium]
MKSKNTDPLDSLRSKKDKRLSWEDTFKEMARKNEDFSDFNITIGDGLDPKDKW